MRSGFFISLLAVATRMFCLYLQCESETPALDIEVKQEPPDYSALEDIFAEAERDPEDLHQECASSTDPPQHAQATSLTIPRRSRIYS